MQDLPFLARTWSSYVIYSQRAPRVEFFKPRVPSGIICPLETYVYERKPRRWQHWKIYGRPKHSTPTFATSLQIAPSDVLPQNSPVSRSPDLFNWLIFAVSVAIFVKILAGENVAPRINQDVIRDSRTITPDRKTTNPRHQHTDNSVSKRDR